jgi:hypothetical protein
VSPRRTAALQARLDPAVEPSDEPAVEPVDPADEVLEAAPPSRRPTATGVWAGLALVAAGLGMIVLAWGLVAAELELHDQVGPLVVAGIGGLAVGVLGLALVDAAVARRDEDELNRQLGALAEVLDELRGELGR